MAPRVSRRSSEVGTAGGAAPISSPAAALSAPPAERTGERLPPHLWTSVWTLLERAVGEATSSESLHKAHAPMLLALMEALSSLYNAARERFEEADVLRLLKLGARLAVPPEIAFPGWEPYAPATAPSPLQLSALRLLEALAPFPQAVAADNLWPLLLWHLLKLIAPRPETAPPGGASGGGGGGAGGGGAGGGTSCGVDGGAAGATPTRPPATHSTPGRKPAVGIPERAYKLLHNLLCSQTPTAARLAVLEDVLQVCTAMPQPQYPHPHTPTLIPSPEYPHPHTLTRTP